MINLSSTWPYRDIFEFKKKRKLIQVIIIMDTVDWDI